MLKIVFFGSSDFSIPSLRACRDALGYEISAVVTTPPQKQGRGLTLQPTVVAQFCAEHQIRCRDFQKLDDSAFDEFQTWGADILVVASYGKIIPERFLNTARVRLNVHPSLLPRHRGASPLNAPFLAGDSETGLSIADITKTLDAGDVYYQEKLVLTAELDSEKIGSILSLRAECVLKDLFRQVLEGKLLGVPQDESRATYAGKLNKEQGRLTFADSALKWDGVVRGLKPWPGAFFEVQGERVVAEKMRLDSQYETGPSGKILNISGAEVLLQLGQGKVVLEQVKPAGKKSMSAGDFLRGRRLSVGSILR